MISFLSGGSFKSSLEMIVIYRELLGSSYSSCTRSEVGPAHCIFHNAAMFLLPYFFSGFQFTFTSLVTCLGCVFAKTINCCFEHPPWPTKGCEQWGFSSQPLRSLALLLPQSKKRLLLHLPCSASEASLIKLC